MDVENPLHKDDIPEAKLVCIEVMGLPMEETETETETEVVNSRVSCNKIMYNAVSCSCACLACIVCFGGFFIFITGFPFAYY
jgi:hypothetical protein